jgi:excisionase family DNA binding protein
MTKQRVKIMSKTQTVSDALASTGRLLEVGEFAGLISYHPESVRRLIRQRRIHAIRFGHTWRVPPAEVAWILANGLPMSRVELRNL